MSRSYKVNRSTGRKSSWLKTLACYDHYPYDATLPKDIRKIAQHQYRQHARQALHNDRSIAPEFKYLKYKTRGWW